VARLPRLLRFDGRPYRVCRVSRASGRKSFQNASTETGSLNNESETVGRAHGLSGKQVALLFVVIMIVLTAVSECSRLSGVRAPEVIKELKN